MLNIEIRSVCGFALFAGEYSDLRDAVVAAVRKGAYLSGANLSGAVLRPGIIASGVPVRRATRSDGYEFFLWPTNVGWRVRAGCRFFSMDEAWEHWEWTRGNTPLGDESLDILTMFELHIQRVGGGDE